MKILSFLLVCYFGSGSVDSAATGYWRLRPKGEKTLCLTDLNNGANNGDGFTVTTCDTTSTYNQFQVLNGPLNLTQIYTGLSEGCRSEVVGTVPGIAPDGASTNLVKQVDQDPGTLSQYWVVTLPPAAYTQPSSGYFWFQNMVDLKCMTAEWLANYVDTYDCANGADTQFWKLGPVDAATGGFTKLTSQAVSKAATPCLEVKGGSPSDGTDTVMAACTDGAFYQGYLGYVQNAKNWKSVGSGRCMDGNIPLGGAPFQYDCVYAATNHQWLGFNYLTDGSNLATRYMNLGNGFCLTWNNSATTAANVILATCDPNNPNQLWKRTN